MSEQEQPEETENSTLNALDVKAPVDYADRAKLPFPVVGIGASAGGIEALIEFFAAVPPDSGMAFVVVQHLPPDHESLMADILGRRTAMVVNKIEHGMPVEANQVYVIRPGFTVTLRNGTFHLGEPVEKRGHRRPVDDFFRSLAHEQQQKSIAVVLSGMGTNGTAGAQAIKAVGGLCIAQAPESAEFASMPSSLIHAGYADRVLQPAEIPPVLVQYVRQPYIEPEGIGGLQAQTALQRERDQLSQVFAILRTRTGHDFSGYKKPTVMRRLQRRMSLEALETVAAYAALLREDAAEVQSLANDLMINVTGFFRDPQAWEALRIAVVRPLVEGWEADLPIRAWVTACASGEEAYSLAMLLAEEIAATNKRIAVKIFATDTADKSLGLARAGIYPGGIEGDLSLERIDRFFKKEDHSYRIRKEIRDMVVFAPHDVLRDPPFSRVDICTCRNLLIYLEPEMQERVMALMHFALRDGGYLFLGNAETLGATKESFGVLSPKWRIYRRAGLVTQRSSELPMLTGQEPNYLRRLELLAPSFGRSGTPSAVQQALLEQFGPPTVVIDREDRIVYFHGDTTPYLVQPVGEPTRDIFEVLNTGLRAAVRNVLRRATVESRAISVVERFARGTEAALQLLVTAAPLAPTRAPEYFRVSFTTDAESGREPAQGTPLRLVRGERDNVLEDELRTARRELQRTVEAFESSNEELKASHEEVISINEELQSANEELETSKEELESLNEELTTVNGQLQGKIGELEAANDDLSNLWSSTNIAVVFLDTQFRVRRFTAAMNDLLELIPADIGRPLAHLAPKFSDSDLLEDAQAVLTSLIPSEAETRSHSGKWYLRRTLPYRTADNRIEGIVITFVDITARKHAEQATALAQSRLQAVIEKMPAAMLIVDAPSGRLLFGNRLAASLFGQPFPLPFVGAKWGAAAAIAFKGFHADGRLYLPEDWPLARSLISGIAVSDEEIDFVRSDGTHGTLSVSAAPIEDDGGASIAVVATFWDVSARNRMRGALRESEERFKLLIESAIDYAIFMTDKDGRITSWNSGAERLLGWSEGEAIGRPAAVLFTPEDRALGIPDREMRTAIDEGHAADERPHIRKDGSRFWASGMLTALFDHAGSLRGFTKIMRDHTQLQDTQDQLRKALRLSEEMRISAESANNAKDEFISTVSHELRTPLNTIRLWSRLLGTGKVPEKDVSSGIQAIDRAAISQQVLIDDLLDVSRMTSGKLRLALRDTRLADAVQGAIEGVRPSAASRGVKLEAQLDDSVGVVRADPDRIQQVVWNLLSNAVKFTPSGGRIRVELKRGGDDLEITVADTGIGIRSEFLPHVFERFRQAEVVATRQHSGLGLGLAIARQLVELHGGTIAAQSDGEGRGATFIVRLPLARRVTVVTEDDEPDATPRDGLAGVDVLLVEDEGGTAEAARRFIESGGGRVRIATSAAAAREAYGLRRPSVIVCDIGLPGEDGYALLRHIRALEQREGTLRVPAIAVTAFARDEDRQRALAAGFDDHLPKPVDPEGLLGTLARMAREAE